MPFELSMIGASFTPQTPGPCADKNHVPCPQGHVPEGQRITEIRRSNDIAARQRIHFLAASYVEKHTARHDGREFINRRFADPKITTVLAFLESVIPVSIGPCSNRNVP